MLSCGKCKRRSIPEHSGVQNCVYCGQGHFLEIYDDGSIAVQNYPFEQKEDEGEE